MGVHSPTVPKLPATLRASFSTLPFSRIDSRVDPPESLPHSPDGAARSPRVSSSQHLATRHSADSDLPGGEPPRMGSLQHMLYGNKTREITGYPTKSRSSSKRTACAVSGGATAVDPLRASAPELTPQVLASLSSPPSRAGGGAAATPAAAAAAAAGGGGSGKGPQGEVYGELASAAASLASVAQKLARGSAAATDRKVAASYDALAAAAADLAASACLIKPLTAVAPPGGDKDGPAAGPSRQQSTASGAGAEAGAGAGGGNGAGTANGIGTGAGTGTLLPSLPSPSGGSPRPHLPRAVDPTSAAATGGAAAGSRAVLPPGGLPPSPSRPGTGAVATGAATSPSRARVAAPRFPGYNPLVHFMTSDLPPPGTAASDRSRPPPSSPITHQ